MSPNVSIVRADICGDCPTPCAFQRDDAAHVNPCASCPIGKWGQWDCDQPAKPGDALAALIERRVLSRAEQHAPGIVAAVRKCGGCGHAQHALGSDRPSRDTGVVI